MRTTDAFDWSTSLLVTRFSFLFAPLSATCFQRVMARPNAKVLVPLAAAVMLLAALVVGGLSLAGLLKELTPPDGGVAAPAGNVGQGVRLILASLVAGAHAILMLRRYRAWWRSPPAESAG